MKAVSKACYIVTIACHLVSLTHAVRYDAVINLGGDCTVARQLIKHNLRPYALPFDWAITPFNSLYRLLENKFNGFLDKKNLVLRKKLRKYFYDTHYNTYIYFSRSIQNSIHRQKQVNYNVNYKKLITVYKKRIKQFYTLLRTSKKVLFIRKNSTKQQAQALSSLIHKLFPHLEYTLLVIGTTAHYMQPWHIKQVYNYYISPHNNQAWTALLRNITIKPPTQKTRKIAHTQPQIQPQTQTQTKRTDAGEFMTIGSYLVARLEQLGLEHYFAVPGDYNLVLLDELLKSKKLKMISCCNELNAGYAADGYARARGLAALVVTYSVGGLSALNAIAGAYAEDLPILVISGAPGSHAELLNQTLHHTTGTVNYRYVTEIFSQVTAQAVSINNTATAPYLIDQAIYTALTKKQPVYINIASNIVKLPLSSAQPLSFNVTHTNTSDQKSLNAAVTHAAQLLNNATRPVLVAGVSLRAASARTEFQRLITNSGYATAVMPDAKGFISEHQPEYMGVYWGVVSSPGCAEIVESSDAYLFAGALFTDYSTAGYTTLIDNQKLIYAARDYVKIQDQIYTHVYLEDFLAALATRVKHNPASRIAFERIYQTPVKCAPQETKNTHETQDQDTATKNKLENKPANKLTIEQLYTEIQSILSNQTTLVVETGDAWFNATELKLPDGCGYEIQMRYGSIGWSVGATLGYSLATENKRRVIGLIGDGSFQMSAQEVSTMIRYKLNPIIILVNNGVYIIEAAIHDGPYNTIKNWYYSKFIDVLNAQDGNGLGLRATTQSELKSALDKAFKHTGVTLIEVIIDKDDCNKNLLKWGSRVSAFNAKPPAC